MIKAMVIVFFFSWGLMLVWVLGVGFENICTVSGKRNEGAWSDQDFVFCFCVWCKSKLLGGRVSP